MDEEDGGEEVSRELVEAYGDASEVLELAEEAFDKVALAVDRHVDGPSDRTLRGAGDAGLSAGTADQIDDGVAVVAAVALYVLIDRTRLG